HKATISSTNSSGFSWDLLGDHPDVFVEVEAGYRNVGTTPSRTGTRYPSWYWSRTFDLKPGERLRLAFHDEDVSYHDYIGSVYLTHDEVAAAVGRGTQSSSSGKIL